MYLMIEFSLSGNEPEDLQRLASRRLNQQPNQSGHTESEKTSDPRPQSRHLDLPFQVELYSEGGGVRLSKLKAQSK